VGLGAQAAMIKGGHMTTKECVDLVVTDDGSVIELATPRLAIAKVLHGGGCTLSALITARLARGESLKTALAWSKRTLLPALEDLVDVGGKLRVIVL
jgi:hydroxymethylpyrimidine/phosphomethylpyrimidine kinase